MLQLYKKNYRTIICSSRHLTVIIHKCEKNSLSVVLSLNKIIFMGEVLKLCLLTVLVLGSTKLIWCLIHVIPTKLLPSVGRAKVKLYFHRAAHSARRLVSTVALYLKNKWHQEMSWTITFKVPITYLTRILELKCEITFKAQKQNKKNQSYDKKKCLARRQNVWMFSLCAMLY